jgi:L-threonylcarbamoyladenylate synthase
MLEAVLANRPVQSKKSAGPTSTPNSPGQLPIHYSPKTRCIRIEPNNPPNRLKLPKRVGVLELGSLAQIGGLSDPKMGSLAQKGGSEDQKMGSLAQLIPPDDSKMGSLAQLGEHPWMDHVLLKTPEEAARRLYDVLHRFDDMAPDLILVLMPPDTPEWAAIRDRLERATVPLS